MALICTKDGLEKAQEELEFLISVKRKEVTEKIKVARSFGDLSENSEYDDAKNEQAMVEAKIAQLEAAIANADVLDEDKISLDVICVGSKVKIYDCEFEEETEYRIVGAAEANPVQNKISDSSPTGAALIGHKVGDIVKVTAPGGVVEYKVLDIGK